MKDFESIGKMIEHFVIERNKQVDGAILGEIIEIAKENEMYKTIYLNEKEIIKALREYMEKQNPKTNYDRIKSMSVEETASFICGIFDGYDEKFICGDVVDNYDEDKIKQWLLQEVNEND